MTERELAAIEARATAATPGPWGMYTDTGEASWHVADAQQVVDEEALAHDCLREDAAFISCARRDIPALVAEIRRLRAALESIVAASNTSSLADIARAALAEPT